MQTLREIRRLLTEAGLKPRKRLGQSFLIDGNLLSMVADLADLTGDEVVLEPGPGTGTLTEELLGRTRSVVAVEIDLGLCELLRKRLGGHENFTLICGDVLAGKHAISPAVLEALGPGTHLVSNLPYAIATPLIAECLLVSWRATRGEGASGCGFERLTFTVQREVADRLSASPGSASYGPVSVLVALLGVVRPGRAVPASAFWPRPKVASRIVRIDFAAARAGELADAETLQWLLSLLFGQRRKQVGSLIRRPAGGFSADALRAALSAAAVDPTVRAEQVPPQKYLAAANALACGAANDS